MGPKRRHNLRLLMLLAWISIAVAPPVARAAGFELVLDGEIVAGGRRFYEAMLDRLAAGTRPPFQDPERIRRTLAAVTRQRAAVEASGEEIDLVLSQLTGGDRTFFENNFIAQRQILLGLLCWWEEGLRAGLSFQQGDHAEMLVHLQAANEAIKTVRAGQALASRGKWQHWYRGDRKMNLARIEELTKQLQREAKELPRGSASEIDAVFFKRLS